MPALVLLLADTPDDAASAGGKAAALGRLLREGLPVPPGFVVTAGAFRAFLRANDLDRALDGVLEPRALELMHDASWPEELRAAIEAAYAALREASGGAPVAVRSSATAEDGADASFAGQHSTHLNIDGADAVLDAIVSCWASLYGESAAHYRASRGVEDNGPAMAVVVQALIPADASGVAFTIDPVSGDGASVVIEAAWGLGSGVVDGIVTPDHYAVRKSDGAITRREAATHRLRVVPAPDGGTHSEELPPDLADRPPLSDARAAELAQLATRIEALHGAPQDIEWALADGTLYVLQSRPVTAAAPALDIPEEGWASEFDTDTSPDTIWTSANVQEVLPDQISPLNLDMTNDIMERFGTEPIERLGVKLTTTEPFSAYFYGRPFLNVSMMLDVTDQTPFGSVEAMMEQYLGQRRDEYVAPPRRKTLARLWRYLLVAPRMLWFSLRMSSEIKKAERITEELARETAAHPFASMSAEELIADIETKLPRSAEVGIIHVSGAGLTGGQFEWLRRCTEAWLDDENGVLQAKLCTGLAGVESAQPAYELWDLSRIVLASPVLREAFGPARGAEIVRRLAALHGEDTLVFRRELAKFLERHGHRSVMEVEIAAKSWSEDLPTVYVMLRNYLHADPTADPRRVEERQRHEREQATDGALKRLGWWRRIIFRSVLRQAQDGVVMREHTKSLMVRTTHRGRQASRELARRFVAAGLLDDLWDLYYLTWNETKGLLRGALAKDEAYVRIRRRRKEEERNKQVLLPETFQGRPNPIRLSDLPLPDGHTLKGIAVSPGRVTGRARVILDPRRDAEIEPGEILVAPVTDAGWTPLFIAAAGVVVDVGGSLSHGSTVAREYGLPAVVNVKVGTRMIRTGQTITVDGTKGVVVLEDGSETQDAGNENG